MLPLIIHEYFRFFSPAFAFAHSEPDDGKSPSCNRFKLIDLILTLMALDRWMGVRTNDWWWCCNSLIALSKRLEEVRVEDRKGEV